MDTRNDRNGKKREKIAYVDPCVHSQISVFSDIKFSRRNRISIDNFNESMNENKKHTFILFSLPNSTIAHPNNGILKVNMFDDGFSAVV